MLECLKSTYFYRNNTHLIQEEGFGELLSLTIKEGKNQHDPVVAVVIDQLNHTTLLGRL